MPLLPLPSKEFVAANVPPPEKVRFWINANAIVPLLADEIVDFVAPAAPMIPTISLADVPAQFKALVTTVVVNEGNVMFVFEPMLSVAIVLAPEIVTKLGAVVDPALSVTVA